MDPQSVRVSEDFIAFLALAVVKCVDVFNMTVHIRFGNESLTANFTKEGFVFVMVFMCMFQQRSEESKFLTAIMTRHSVIRKVECEEASRYFFVEFQIVCIGYVVQEIFEKIKSSRAPLAVDFGSIQFYPTTTNETSQNIFQFSANVFFICVFSQLRAINERTTAVETHVFVMRPPERHD